MEEKKTTKKTTATAKTEVANKAVDENALLKAQLEEMKAQMALMAQMIGNNNAPAPRANKKHITFVNLVKGTLVMRGTRIWRIDGQFNNITVSEDEADAIITNSNNLVRSGCVYITDAEYVEERHLADSYNFILSDEQLKSILSIDYTQCVAMYKSTTEAQQSIIADMIASKVSNREEVDANIVKQIGKLSGRKFDDLEPDDEE